MPQEPRSFFERLTGAKVLSPSQNRDDRGVVQDMEEELYEPDFSEQDVQDAAHEEDVDMQDGYAEDDVEQLAQASEEQEGQLTVDVFQDDENIIVQSTIAGVSPDDLDVSITNDMVTIRGERRRQYNVDEEDYFYQECYWGTFSRSIILPVEIDADRAEAKIKNGILTIRIPKANTAVTRKLKVKSL